MSRDCLKNVFQTLIHEQNNELSKIIMHLENALEDQNFEEIKLALGVFDSYSELTQKYSGFVKKSFSQDPTPVSSSGDVALLEFVLKEVFKKRKKELHLAIDTDAVPLLTFEQVVSIAWTLVLQNKEDTKIQIEFPSDRKTVLMNSVAFNLETVWKNSI